MAQRKNSWTPIMEQGMIYALLHTKTPEAFIATYRKQTQDTVHTEGGIFTHLVNVTLPANNDVKLPENFMRDFRKLAQETNNERKTTKAVPAEPVPHHVPKLNIEPDVEWLSATQAGSILGKTDKWIAANWQSLEIETTKLKVQGELVRYYKRSSVESKIPRAVEAKNVSVPEGMVSKAVLRQVIATRTFLGDTATLNVLEKFTE